MIIAMITMWMMQPSVHDVIDVITVGHAFVPTVWPMSMRAPGAKRAPRRIGVAHLNNVFVDVILVHVMQMTIVEVIHMAIMPNSGVSAAWTMLVSVTTMMRLGAGNHGLLLTPGVLPRRLPSLTGLSAGYLAL
jgi:hypothetical protein